MGIVEQIQQKRKELEKLIQEKDKQDSDDFLRSKYNLSVEEAVGKCFKNTYGDKHYIKLVDYVDNRFITLDVHVGIVKGITLTHSKVCSSLWDYELISNEEFDKIISDLKKDLGI